MEWRAHPEIDDLFVLKVNQQLLLKKEKPLHPILIKHLYSIGMRSADEIIHFMFPSKKHAHSPWLLKNMKSLIEHIEDAVIEGKKITVVGDYDVDGVTATAIAYKTLKELGAEVDTYIPHRVEEGYGIKAKIVEHLHKNGTKVILTVDNGIAANEAIALAKSYGMIVLVTDHHTPPETLPDADVIVNPNLADCSYPFKEIAGGVVAYKMAQALYEYMGFDEDHVEQHLELAALCTIADVMPLVNENRYYVRAGIERMRKNPSRAMKALLKVESILPKYMTEQNIGFKLAPMLNAAGRLDSADLALKMLLAETPIDAAVTANNLKNLNDNRQALQSVAKEEAFAMANDDPIQVIVMPDLHEGLAGIIAGNVREEFNKPAFVFVKAKTENGEEILKGSARSVPGFHLYDAIKQVSDKHPDWFVGWGGHSGAAGMSIVVDCVDDFREAINDVYKQNPPQEPVGIYLANMDEESLQELSVEIPRLAPYGHGNPMPCVRVDAEIVDSKIFGSKAPVHLRLTSDKGNEFTMFFGANRQIELAPASIFLEVTRSVWMGRERMDLFVLDVAQ